MNEIARAKRTRAIVTIALVALVVAFVMWATML